MRLKHKMKKNITVLIALQFFSEVVTTPSSGCFKSPRYPERTTWERKMEILNVPHPPDKDGYLIMLYLEDLSLTYMTSQNSSYCMANLTLNGQNICGFKSGTRIMVLPRSCSHQYLIEGMDAVWNLYTASLPITLTLELKTLSKPKPGRYKITYLYLPCESARPERYTSESRTDSVAVASLVFLLFLVLMHISLCFWYFFVKKENAAGDCKSNSAVKSRYIRARQPTPPEAEAPIEIYDIIQHEQLGTAPLPHGE